MLILRCKMEISIAYYLLQSCLPRGDDNRWNELLQIFHWNWATLEIRNLKFVNRSTAAVWSMLFCACVRALTLILLTDTRNLHFNNGFDQLSRGTKDIARLFSDLLSPWETGVIRLNLIIFKKFIGNRSWIAQ